VYGKGVYWIDPETPLSTWTEEQTGLPENALVYCLEIDDDEDIYAGLGYPYAWEPAPVTETGVWLRKAGAGESWTQISSAEMNDEPVLWLLPVGSDTLYVGTWAAYQVGEGGLWLGEEDGQGSWQWTRLLARSRVAGVSVSPIDPDILYAVVAPWNHWFVDWRAGVYKSVDAGLTWSLLGNNGLTNLRNCGLVQSIRDDAALFLTTMGGGLFKGTLLPPVPAEDLSGRQGDGSTVVLEWTDVAKSEQGYRIYGLSGGKWKEVATAPFFPNEDGLPTEAFVEFQATGRSKRARYRVCAFNEVGESEECPEVAVKLTN
jgi:hypothetical protein